LAAGFTAKDPPRPLLDLLCPSSLDVGTRLGHFVEAGQELGGDIGPLVGRQIQNLAEQVFDVRCHRLKCTSCGVENSTASPSLLSVVLARSGLKSGRLSSTRPVAVLDRQGILGSIRPHADEHLGGR
jgi:hypothetical protein